MLSFFQVSQTRAAGHMAGPLKLVGVAGLCGAWGCGKGLSFLSGTFKVRVLTPGGTRVRVIWSGPFQAQGETES